MGNGQEVECLRCRSLGEYTPSPGMLKIVEGKGIQREDGRGKGQRKVGAERGEGKAAADVRVKYKHK